MTSKCPFQPKAFYDSMILRKMGTDFLVGPVAIGQGGNGFKLKDGRSRLDIKKKFFMM